MKFCGKCGAQMDDSARVCGQCGTPFMEVAPQRPVNPVPGGIPQNNGVPTGGVPTGGVPANALGSSGAASNPALLFYMGAAVLNILMIIFLFVKTIVGKGSVWGFTSSESFSLNQIFAEGDVGGLTAVYIILFLVSTALLVVPILTNKTDKRFWVIFPIIVCFLALILLIVMLIATREEAKDYYGLVKVSLTFGGVMYILFDLLDIALLFLAAVKAKAKK